MDIDKNKIIEIAKKKYNEGVIFILKKDDGKNLIKMYPKGCCITYIYDLLKKDYKFIELITYDLNYVNSYDEEEFVQEFFNDEEDNIQRRVLEKLLKKYKLYEKGNLYFLGNYDYIIEKKYMKDFDLLNLCNIVNKLNKFKLDNVQMVALECYNDGYSIKLLSSYVK